MNRTLLIASMVGGAILLASGAYWLGTRAPSNSSSDMIESATGRRVLYWHDPMYPGQRFDKPGKSPYMDMQLAPVYADDPKAGDVSVDPRVQQRLGVRTSIVERKVVAAELNVAGNVEYNERDVAVVQARANGFIERVHVRTPLQAVRAGQVLAELYLPDWVAAQEEFLAVQGMQSEARSSLLTAAVQRMRLAGMSDDHVAQVEQSKTVQPRLSVRAPIAGVVTELVAREGMTVANGAALFRINGLDTVWVYAELPEAQMSRIRVGAQVTGSATALPGIELHGSVLAMLPQVSPATRTAKARIELRNRDRQLTPGMFVALKFVTPASAPVLVVPTEAVIVTGQRTVVVIAAGAGKFRPVVVTTGLEGEGMTEVTSGLEEGQVVVTSAQFLIDSESSLKSALSRMDAPSLPPSPGTGRGSEPPLPVPGEVVRSVGEGHADHGAPR